MMLTTSRTIPLTVTALTLLGAIGVGWRAQSRNDQRPLALARGLPPVASPAPAWRDANSTPTAAQVFDLTRLAPPLRRAVSVILLIPLAAVAICLFRNVVGIQTAGRFTPMLIALSFVFADWRAGMVVLAAVLLLGLATRTVLDRLQLLMLPRLSVILTLVVCLTVFGVSVLDHLRLAPTVPALLLPLVIVTMIVERFYVSGQEDGLGAVLARCGATAVVGFFCYLILGWEAAGELLLAYPEIHFFTVAVLVLIGRYTGYQLTELWRFRDAVEA